MKNQQSNPPVPGNTPLEMRRRTVLRGAAVAGEGRGSGMVAAHRGTTW
jgi:hypothetical protein